MNLTLPTVLGFVEFARQYPDKPALVCVPDGATVTYGQLNGQANRFAHALRTLGLRDGDCMAICLPNAVALVTAILAAQRIGLYFTLISPKASIGDVRYITADSGSKLLLIAATAEVQEASDLPFPGCQLVLCASDDASPGPWERLVADQSTDLPANPRPGMEMIYSSGTTGRPKGIRRDFHCKNWGEVDSRNLGALQWLRASSQSVYLSTSPLYHSAPYRYLCAFLDAGATVILMKHFDPQLSLECIDQHACSHSVWVPTMFQRLLKLDPGRRAMFSGKSMTHAVHGAAPCARHVKQAMIDWWGPVIYEYYSGTEGIGRTFIDSLEWLAHPGSVGKPSGCRVHILDPQGEELALGLTGQIFFESEVRFSYWNDHEKTRSSISRQGWRTFGDIGHLDDAGYLYLTDRAGFMVISGGVNIYPQEIENTLLSHPDVVDAAVFGVPDEDLGEKLCAVIQLAAELADHEETAAAIRQHCKVQGGSVKTPKLIRFCCDFPRLDTGKVQKRLLRERLVSEPQPWAAVGSLLPVHAGLA